MRLDKEGRFAAVLVAVLAAALAADPAFAQGAAPQRLNWFWSIFAGFVLAGLAVAIFAWLFEISRLHWIFVVILWAATTYLLRYHTAI
jgi:hypothetical protein